jgi:3'-5' exoribonuclease
MGRICSSDPRGAANALSAAGGPPLSRQPAGLTEEGWRTMASNGPFVVKLSDLVDGEEAVCFAALFKKTRGMTKTNQPYLKCLFRDKRAVLEAPVWHDHRYFRDADTWPEGTAYRLRVYARLDLRFGMQIDILDARPATEDDGREGYDFFDLVPSSKIPPDELKKKLDQLIERYIDHPQLKILVRTILDENMTLFSRMPAAQNLHHSYTSGLLEHVWSMTRVAGFVADHYARYYCELNPPLNRSLIVAAAILHDVGKLRELEYHPFEAKYTKEGCLIGHVLIGRDMVREAAQKIDGFPQELLLQLEHAILAHHGKREFGAPIPPLTLEALILSYVDELDAKVNMVARERLDSPIGDPFTERIYALENRRFYKGVPENPVRAGGESPSA